ncbi:long-chain fatty acid--CoA ligase [Pseudenhygromyxa sp. WMMC2535]|uniref:acyl-CoA synthetase n=1 Tax=Pseudenhygromyxa sp. WMMC2535 TaxID=2712867 RepID=UPI0015520009|nr:long-chain fatty acid--CoA ligase [Pseudenhygromyxa sp. WMMC2535]NVB43319.1 long-chain fatty acid--CoA ligase [Pseudenhygromyxa sp. WMMC2535]
MTTDWLQRRAWLSPTAPAIIDVSGPGGIADARTIDYRTLDAETNQVANALAAQGIGLGDRVAVLAKNRVEYVQLWFACAKLGAALQALNWRLTARELGPLITQAGPRIMFWDREFAELIDSLRPQLGDAKIVALDEPRAGDLEFSSFRDQPSTPPPRPEFGPDQPWVLCYTGGTTGLPKAALLTHGTIAWNAINTVSSWGLSKADVAVLNAPMFHTGGLNVFTAPLVHAGGCSILCREFDLDQLYDLITDHGVTCFFGVPAMFQAMQAHPRWASAPLERLSLIISGGAPCPEPVFERFWARGIDFKTGYGLTEAGPNNFWLPPERVRDKPGAVGWPLMHVEVRIIDQHGAVCGPEEVGELWIRGPHVCPGYDKNPEATAESFIDGWLHTGDLARADAEGCVTIVGRSKDMIISGGENIYPAEIESAISAHPAVAEAALIGVPHERWGEVGRAFVVLASGAQLDAEGLLAYLGEHLARYKLPKSVVFLDSLPRTGAGKIDKRALEAR